MRETTMMTKRGLGKGETRWESEQKNTKSQAFKCTRFAITTINNIKINNSEYKCNKNSDDDGPDDEENEDDNTNKTGTGKDGNCGTQTESVKKKETITRKRREEWESTTTTNNHERQQQAKEQKVTPTYKNQISELQTKQSDRAAMLGLKEGGKERRR